MITQSYKIHELGALHLLPEIEDKSIDMICTDLPYEKTQCKWDIIIPFKPLWEQYKRIIKDNGAIILTSSQPFTSMLIMSNIDMFKYCWIWEKTQPTGFLNVNKRPLLSHEEICVFYKKQCTYNPQKTFNNKSGSKFTRKAKTSNKSTVYGKTKQDTEYNMDSSRFPKSVQIFSNDRQKIKKDMIIHPTQKPVSLIDYLIKTYTNEGDVVHDSCLGSGTTLESCARLNRNCVGFEISNEWESNYKPRIKKGKQFYNISNNIVTRPLISYFKK